MSNEVDVNRAGGTITFLEPHPGVSAYFLLAGTMLFFALRLLSAFGNRLDGLAPSGGNYHDGRFLPWAVLTYSILGGLTGYFGFVKNRKILLVHAHGAPLFAAMFESGKLTEGLFAGLVLIVLLAIPFGYSWFLLVTAKT